MTEIVVFPKADIPAAPSTIEEWGRNLGQLWLAFEHLPWMLGDSINEGLDRWGEQSPHFWPDGYAHKTIMGFAWVARRVPEDLRRVGELTWSHHKIAAGLEGDTLVAALDHGIADAMSCAQFTSYISSLKGLEDSSKDTIGDSRGRTDGSLDEALAYTRSRIGRTWSPIDQEELEALLIS